MTREELTARYDAAAHAMQTGVAYEHLTGSNDAAPKHLRVGINSAMVNDAALVRLLMSKGIITDMEYLEALTVEMEAERDRYAARLPGNVKLV
jgi:hypothetical protein